MDGKRLKELLEKYKEWQPYFCNDYTSKYCCWMFARYDGMDFVICKNQDDFDGCMQKFIRATRHYEAKDGAYEKAKAYFDCHGVYAEQFYGETYRYLYQIIQSNAIRELNGIYRKEMEDAS